MANTSIQNYSISGADITLSDLGSITQEFVRSIHNQTQNYFIYKFGDPVVNFTIAGNVITLTSPAPLTDTDKLEIIYAETKDIAKFTTTIDFTTTTFDFSANHSKSITFRTTNVTGGPTNLYGSLDGTTYGDEPLSVYYPFNAQWAGEVPANTTSQCLVGAYKSFRLLYEDVVGSADIEIFLNPELEIIGVDGKLRTGSQVSIAGAVTVASLNTLATEDTLTDLNDKIAAGSTFYKRISTASTNEDVVKDSGGNLFNIIAMNSGTSLTYLKLYNLAVAPDLSIDIPVATIMIPADPLGAGVVAPFSVAINFDTGIAIAITGGVADNNTTAIDADVVVINIAYA